MKNLQKMIPLLAAFVWSACSSLTPSEPTVAGVWKLNLAKSQLGGQTFSFQKMDSGKFRFDSQGYTYDFDLSGKEFPTPDGGTAAVVSSDPNTNEATLRMNGKVIATYVMAAHGNQGTLTMKVPKENGSIIEQVMALERVSGGPGF